MSYFAFTVMQMRTLLGRLAVLMATQLVGARHEAALSPRVTEPGSDLPGGPCILLLSSAPCPDLLGGTRASQLTNLGV